MIWAKWYEFHLAMSKEHSITSTITMITNLANQNNVQWYSLTFSHSTRVTRQAFSLGSHFTHTHTPRKLDLPVQTKPKHNTLLSLLHTSLFVHNQHEIMKIIKTLLLFCAFSIVNADYGGETLLLGNPVKSVFSSRESVKIRGAIFVWAMLA